MLRTLAFGIIAAVAGRQLYKSGALKRFGEDFNRRLDTRRASRGSSMTGTTQTGMPGMQPSGMQTPHAT